MCPVLQLQSVAHASVCPAFICIPLTAPLAQILDNLLKERESAILTYSSILSKLISLLTIIYEVDEEQISSIKGV